MNENKNEITNVNQQTIIKNAEGQKSFRELVGFYKGSIASVLTFVMTNKVAVFLGGCKQDDLMFWLGEQAVKHPALKSIIVVTKDVIKVAWNLLVTQPELCALVISGFVALGVTIAHGVKKHKLKKQYKKGKIIPQSNELKKTL